MQFAVLSFTGKSMKLNLSRFKSFFYLALIIFSFSDVLAATQSDLKVSSCVRPFIDSALKIVDQALLNGHIQIEKLPLKELKARLVDGSVYIECHSSLSLSIDGRRSAIYRKDSKNKNSRGIAYNYIGLTADAKNAPDELKGYLLLHEFINVATDLNDEAYSYTLQLYMMSEGLVQPMSAQKIYTLFGGTSSGVGGGDWRNLGLKLTLLKRMIQLFFLQHDFSKQLNSFLGLNIEIKGENYFGSFDDSVYAVLAKFESETCPKGRKKSMMVIVRESYYETMPTDPETLNLIENYIFELVNRFKDGTAQCFP